MKSLNGTSVEKDLPWGRGRDFGSLCLCDLWPDPSEQAGGCSTTPGEHEDGVVLIVVSQLQTLSAVVSSH